MIPAIISGVSALGSMVLGHQQQRQAEHANQASADKQMAFQQRQSETQYQRAVADMKAAGLNPALSLILKEALPAPLGRALTLPLLTLLTYPRSRRQRSIARV